MTTPDVHAGDSAPEASAPVQPDGAPAPERESWVSYVVAHAVSIAIHVVLLVAIAAFLAYQASKEKPPPAELDVIEFVEQSAAPQSDIRNEMEVEAKTAAEEISEVEEVTQDAAPELEVETPEVEQPLEQPLEDDSAARQQRLGELQNALGRLRANVAGSGGAGGGGGGGDGGTDPHSRGSKQARWVIRVGWRDSCDEFGKMLKDIGIREIGVISGDDIIYIDPVRYSTRRGPIDFEDRISWVTDKRLMACEATILARAHFKSQRVVWFMDRAQEPVLERLEADYAQQHNKNIAKVVQTVFTPYQRGSVWKLRIKSMQ